MTRKIDLHAHTTASDGVLTPEQLVRLAIDNGLNVLAITDHDTTDGVDAAVRAAAGSPVTIWPGVELSTDVPTGEVHVLGYLIDHQDPAFQETLSNLRAGREERAKTMIVRLHDLGVSITWERVQEIAGTGAIGRPHVAEALVEAGHVRSVSEAFDRFLGRTGPAYVERARLTPVEAVQIVRRFRGIPVLAHPTYAVPDGTSPGDSSAIDRLLPGLLRELVIAGLIGMEVFYSRYTRHTISQLRALARQFGLVPTGGSDYHGREPVGAALGSLPVPWESVRRIEHLAAEARAAHIRGS
ncbi:MAG TPA: PHP domain-containing protein [Chloroflexota bacterium]|nr:PHP domain-containing protein [Chloroflexota bacterium]